ncbi:MAG: 50S ribosomal protein L21e [Candidatus Hodarchaeales archaeon]|jgi:large subunit ribosomal protein L21e
MVRTSKGTRFRSRNVFRKKPRDRGLPPLGRILTEYMPGDKVDIIIEPSVQKGSPHRRFHGKTARVEVKRGNSYILSVKDGNRMKTVISRPEHIRKHLE